MGIKTLFSSIFGKKTDFMETSVFEKATDIAYREAAFWTCVNLIANAIAKCEVKTLKNGVELRGGEYYFWNIQPNPNQNAAGFWRKLIAKLCVSNEALIVDYGGYLYVTDGFIRNENGIWENTYSGVVIGENQLDKTFYEHEVMYFHNSESNMKSHVDAIFADYSGLLSAAVSFFRANSGVKVKFKQRSLQIPSDVLDQNTWTKNYVEKLIKPFLESTNGVIPLGNGMDLERFDTSNNARQSHTRDIKNIIDDIFDFTARSFRVPPALLKGELTNYERAVSDFVTFCITPLISIFREEIIRKRIGKERFLQGYDIVFDTKQIIWHDLLSVATSIDKLVSSGAYSINELRKILGETAINESWADEHFMTLNYSKIQGGENIEVL